MEQKLEDNQRSARFLGMTDLPAEQERALLGRGRRALLVVWNAEGSGRRLLDVGDTYALIQLIARSPRALRAALALPSAPAQQTETEEVKLAEIPLASMEALVKEYNKHSDKPIAKFRNRATAEERVAAVLPAQRGRKPINPTITFLPNGQSQVRASSTRGEVLAFIRENSPVAKHDIDRKFGRNTAGFIDKLAEMGHVKVSDR